MFWLEKPETFEEAPKDLFEATSISLMNLGVPQERVDEMWRLLSGIIHLGNIDFEDDEDAHHGGTRLSFNTHIKSPKAGGKILTSGGTPRSARRGSTTGSFGGSNSGNDSKRSLHTAAALWGLSPPALLKLLTMRTIEAGGNKGSRRESTLTKPLTTSEAQAARDNIARLVYSLLFDWIIAQINQILSVDETSRSDDARERPVRSLGLLDLFGFESFARNDIEQLLINMANEALQVKL